MPRCPAPVIPTLLIAERVQPYADVWAEQDRMPVFPVPEGHDQGVPGCVTRCTRGCPAAARSFPAGGSHELHRARRVRINVICGKGFPSYFLIVADLITYAVHRHPGGAGPRIDRRLTGGLRAGHHQHRPDPARSALRAVPQPERPSAPDIDIDFDDRRRGRWCATPPTSGAATAWPRSSPSEPSRPKRH